ncbi:hypothetical protein TSAR_006614 [Trichomalopsis sarcophagae]|uniref:Uncharacterized protein n=1 Tax=Trichomalopsis sarcophagae TaxID=543379 RepID=A0A232EHP4_9HYME|nr:hypothetical protein TSAR_006614 [Trichomalopsis sarcophagae]
MDIKAKFFFVSETCTDSKSTVVKVKRIQLLGQEESFLFPVDKQTSAQHKQLYENSIVKNVVKSLKVRNKFRNVVLTLSEELKNIHLDTEVNVVLYDEYLEEITTVREPNVNREPTIASERKTSSLVNDIVIEKFNAKLFVKLGGME